MAIPGLEFRTGAFPVTCPMPPSPLLSQPKWDLLMLDKKKPQTCSLLSCRQNGPLAFRWRMRCMKGDEKKKKKKMKRPFSPPTPSLEHLSRHQCSHSLFPGTYVYQRFPLPLLSGLLCPLTLAFECFFLPITSLLLPLWLSPSPSTIPPILLIMCLRLR